MVTTIRNMTVESATKAMSKKEDVGLQWEIKAFIEGISGNYPTSFFGALTQLPTDPEQAPYKGLQIRCAFSRGNTRKDASGNYKSGQYHDHYYWDLVDWNTTDDITPLPAIGQYQQPEKPPQGPQTEREAGEQMQQETQQPGYEGWRYGQARNLAAISMGQTDFTTVTFDQWRYAVEQLAAEIAPTLTNEFFAYGPQPQAPGEALEPVAEEQATETPDGEWSSEDGKAKWAAEGIASAKLQQEKEAQKTNPDVEVVYNPDGERVFTTRGKFMQAAGKELGFDVKEVFALLGVTSISYVNWEDPRTWLDLEKAYNDQLQASDKPAEDLPF